MIGAQAMHVVSWLGLLNALCSAMIVDPLAVFSNLKNAGEHSSDTPEVHREIEAERTHYVGTYLVLSGVIKPEHDVFGYALSVWHDYALYRASNGQDMYLHAIKICEDVRHVTRHAVGVRVGARGRRRPTRERFRGRSYSSGGMGQALAQTP